MLHFIYGRTGSGKSRLVYDIASSLTDKPIYVLIPDREAVIAERRFAASPNAGGVNVVTFRRLCNFVFRRYGGICESFVSHGAKNVMMYNTFRALSPLLSSYKNIAGGDTAAAKKLTSIRSELYKNAVSPRSLMSASEKMESETGKKLSDIALLLSAFDAEVGERFKDPDGMISAMNEKLAEHDFFHGSVCFIDSFTVFSKDQLICVREIIKSADDVYITLPYLPEDAEIPAFASPARTDARLRAICEELCANIAPDIMLRAGKRAESAELTFLASNLFSLSNNTRAVYTEKPKNIRVISAADAFAEAEAVCIDICKKIRAGARYRELAVIVRRTEEFSGVIDAMMRKYGIPYFISARSDITERAFIKFILSALTVAERGFARELVISYIKTDFAGLTPDEINLFEDYVRKWSIKGERFYDEYEWNMNPAGYRERLSEADAEKLVLLSDIRRRAVRPLKDFADALSGEHSVRYFCEKIYDFALSLGSPEKIKRDAYFARERGEKALAAELSQLFSVFCGVLDALVDASGEIEVRIGEFIPMLRLVLSETDIGKIPTSLDEVTVYEASAGGIPDIKTAYILGAYDGGFPAGVADDGIFTEKERSALLEKGIEISNGMEHRLCEEMFFFYTAACSPSEQLVITYPFSSLSGEKLTRSSALDAIEDMFPQLTEESFEAMPTKERIERACASFEYIGGGGNISAALREYYLSREEYREKTAYLDTPITSSHCRLSPESARELFPKSIKTSYSRLEKYALCNFSYFCEYELALRDSAPASFESLNKGSLIHKILETTVKYAAENPETDDEVLREKIRQSAREYIASIAGDADVSPRLERLFRYLCLASEKFVFKIRDEFTKSRFTPKDFELTIGEGEEISPIKLENENGAVALRGKIDRVDAYEDGTGKIYIRVADYKTGSKTFKLSNIDAGLDLQMLLYLFSVCKNGKKRYGGELYPAGVMYLSINTSPEKAMIGEEKEDKDTSIGSGLFLENEEVLTAMEPLLEGKIIPVKRSAKGALSGNLIAEEAFAELEKSVTDAVMKSSDMLRAGIADARPQNPDACRFCKMQPVCRIRKVRK